MNAFHLVARAGGVVPVCVAAFVLAVSRERIYQLLARGKLESVKLNGGRFVGWRSVVSRSMKLRQHDAQRGPALSVRAKPLCFKLPVVFVAAGSRSGHSPL